MTPRLLLSCCLLALSTLAAAQDNKPLTLSCPDPRDKGQEAKLIRKLASDIVKRTSRHQLDIQVAGTVKKLVDKPPHDEPLAGLHYYFCDRKEGFILLYKEDESDFGGTLINEQTGTLTPGGQTVMFSPDRRAYFATVQPDGLDGEEWSIYAVDGKQSWSGYSFIPNPKKPDYAYAYLDKPAWTATGEFTASASCATKQETTWPVKLVKKDGKWDWAPKKTCPEAS